MLSTIFFLSSLSYSQQNDFDQINYLNQIPPGDSAVLFAPEVVSTKKHWEEKISFSPDGKEMFFGRHHDARSFYFKPRIFYSEQMDGKWSVPDTASFTKKQIAGFPILSPDGQTLFSETVVGKTEKGVRGQIVYSNKKDNKWQNLKSIVPDLPNKEGFGLAQITHDGTFYFYDRYDRVVYFSKLENGVVKDPKPLPAVINPAVEFYVSRQNDYIIFRPINWTNPFHISFKKSENQWTMPVPLSTYFKKKDWDALGYGPVISPDEKYMFFGKNGDIYWVSSQFINEIRKRQKP